ncbi:MAG: hypothetical protein IKS49_05320 [Actinomycetaceae bacterium]|nr:hypothetical protein [Actinomycetaceae bacterium]
MAEKKKHKIVSASTGKEVKAGAESAKKPVVRQAAPVGNAGALRAGAVILWVVALLFEVLAFLVLYGKVNLQFMPTLWQLIGFLVLDLVCVVIGSQLWKKANHIKPASEESPLKFWLWNNMGVIASIICFMPIIILILISKDIDKKTKTIASIVAIVALLVGGAAGYDWNPVSQEQQKAAVEVLGDGEVYWAPFGHVYHTHDDCGALNRSDVLTKGTVEEAIASNRTRLCSFCAKRDHIHGVATDDVDVSDYVPEDEPEDEAETEAEPEAEATK